MFRPSCWRVIGRLVLVIGVVGALGSTATAHCLSGGGIYNGCQHAAQGKAISARQHVVNKPYRGYGAKYGYHKPVIHRTDKLSARNRNGGIR